MNLYWNAFKIEGGHKCWRAMIGSLFVLEVVPQDEPEDGYQWNAYMKGVKEGTGESMAPNEAKMGAERWFAEYLEGHLK
jgi:hypothetical protein